MTDFIGYDQARAVLARLRGELRRDVLTAPAPRVFGLGGGPPISGGYGLDFAAVEEDMPAAWVDQTHQELCPVLEEGIWADFETGAAIDDETSISPFTDREIRGGIDTGAGTLTRGSGFMVVSVSDLPGGATIASGIGVHGQLAKPVQVAVQITVPAKRGVGQMNIYASTLAAVLAHQLVKLNENAALRFTDQLPQSVQIQETTTQWSTGVWVATTATRVYREPSALGLP